MSCWQRRNTRDIYVSGLLVERAYRRMGLASWLLSECEHYARKATDAGAVTLSVQWTNGAALALYKRYG